MYKNLTLHYPEVIEAKFTEWCRFKAEILQLGQQKKYCVNFARTEGSAMLYYEQSKLCFEHLCEPFEDD